MKTKLANLIDYFYDPKRGYSAFLKVGHPPYPSVSGAGSAQEAQEELLLKVQEPKRSDTSPRS